MNPRYDIQSSKREKREKNLFKSTVMKKTSAILATLLIVSILTPMLAFAATYIGDVSYNKSNGTVKATVYTDDAVTDSVYLSVYAPDGTLLKYVYEDTATKTVNGVTYYDFTTNVTSATYDYLSLKGFNVVDSVYKSVYNSNTNNGGGGIYFPTDIVGSDNKADASKLTDLLKAKEDAELKIKGEYVLLPASALVNGKTLTIVNDLGSYTLPLTKADFNAIAKSQNVSLSELWIRVTIAKVTDSAVQDAAKAAKGTALANAVDFKITTEVNGKTATDVTFGNTYVKRTINIDKAYSALNANKSTGVLYDAVSKKFTFVPSVFAAKGDKSEVAIWRVGNSVYTAIELNNSFSDISTHWAKANIEMLANKLVVDGYENNMFGPERNITRAEFAAMVVRALGITPTVTGSTYFSDVASGQWYTDVVNTAAKAGLVDGYADGTFKPNANINREELAALVVRALKYAGKDVSVSAADQISLLSRFTDSNQIVWGQKEVAAAIKAGIVDGMTDNKLEIRGTATRAQAATMLKRLLGNAGFIN